MLVHFSTIKSHSNRLRKCAAFNGHADAKVKWFLLRKGVWGTAVQFHVSSTLNNRWAVSLTLRPLYTLGQTFGTLSLSRWVSPRDDWMWWRREKYLPSSDIENPVVQPQHRLSYPCSFYELFCQQIASSTSYRNETNTLYFFTFHTFY
jgi:hypothetical protein